MSGNVEAASLRRPAPEAVPIARADEGELTPGNATLQKVVALTHGLRNWLTDSMYVKYNEQIKQLKADPVANKERLVELYSLRRLSNYSLIVQFLFYSIIINPYGYHLSDSTWSTKEYSFVGMAYVGMASMAMLISLCAWESEKDRSEVRKLKNA